MRKLVIVAALALVPIKAEAHAHRRHHLVYHHRHHLNLSHSDARPSAWCGWFMRKRKHVADPRFNLARNWTHWGHSSGLVLGAVLVWPHHVGEVAGPCTRQHCLVLSGNDGHRIRTRYRRLDRVIAVRSI